MDIPKSREASILSSARVSLKESGELDYADLITAVWEVCFGGCGFNLTPEEESRSCEVSKLLFCSPSSVSMMVVQSSQRISDPVLRTEVRALSKSLQGNG